MFDFDIEWVEITYELESRELKKRYKKRLVVDGVSIGVNQVRSWTARPQRRRENNDFLYDRRPREAA